MKTFKQYIREVFDKHFPVEKIGVTKTESQTYFWIMITLVILAALH